MYAVVCEADRRVLGMEPYDCQILGAIALHYGYLTEMNAGEGKTLMATMPLYLNALTGKSVILVTANDYLARRDAEEMAPVYEFPGMSVQAGVKPEDQSHFGNEEKRRIYQADIVYTTHGALGFDYLLNHLVSRAQDRFMREFYYVIIDEADMVLLDAATMPLVISGAPRVSSNLHEMADFFVATLEPERDYIVEEQSVWLTDAGVAYAEQYFGIKGFYAAENFELNRHITLAMRARVLMKKERDYIIAEDGTVSLLDKGTGRVLSGMKLRGGIHQAIEVKEKLALSQENRSVATITFQNLFRLFPRMSGMSGTLADARRELWEVYHKRVAVIPPNRPVKRQDGKDLFFRSAREQYEAAVWEAVRHHQRGQPVLMVTQSIADTRLLSQMLTEKQAAHSVLNANNAYWEAQVIREAGQKGMITVSTGMAGRGTDIRLGPGVKELGGLAVIAVGRMANRRLERQVRGRSGRQGDPGCSRFYVSLEDDIVFAEREKILGKYVEQEHSISKRKLRKIINGSQRLQEEQAFFQRKRAVDYDSVLKRQRTMLYEARDKLLDGEGLEADTLRQIAYKNVKCFFKKHPRPKTGDVRRYVLNNISYSLDESFLSMEQKSGQALKKALFAYVENAWRKKAEMFSSDEQWMEFLRHCCLRAIDDAWIEEVDYLQQLQILVNARVLAQRNPVFEYQEEAYRSFIQM